jgi:copper chaperone
MEKKVLTVEGMSCGHCKAAVEKVVTALTGVVLAEVDLAAKTLSVEYDAEQTTLEEIKEVVDDAGFTVL